MQFFSICGNNYPCYCRPAVVNPSGVERINPSGVEREHMSKLFPGKHPSHKHGGGSSKHSSTPTASPAAKKSANSSSSTNSISSKKQPPSVDVVRKNLNFSRPPGAGSGGAAGGDILGSIMMGMQNNMQKKD